MIFKGVIQESNIADNIKAIGKEYKLVGIAEMDINIRLFRIRT